MSVVLACDLGSTSLRVALVGEDGRVHHAVSIANEQGSADEVDPRLWRGAFAGAVDQLATAAGSEFDAVEAIAISSVTRTQVFLGADHQPLRPAITWRDTRAQREIERIRSLFPADHPEIGQLTAFHPLARLAWLAAEEPDMARRLRAVVEPKDYLNLWLTGECTIDPVGSARLLAARNGLKGLGYDESVIPRVVEPGTVIGRVRVGRLAGRPVVAMGNDTWASFDGQAYVIDDLLKAQGVKKGRIPLVSVDGGQESYRRIADPESTFLATIAIPFEEMGAQAVDAVDRIVVKKQPASSVSKGSYLFVDAVLVDTENVKQFMK